MGGGSDYILREATGNLQKASNDSNRNVIYQNIVIFDFFLGCGQQDQGGGLRTGSQQFRLRVSKESFLVSLVLKKGFLTLDESTVKVVLVTPYPNSRSVVNY
jgi:hypothetical protein